MNFTWRYTHLDSIPSTNLWLQEEYARGTDIRNLVVTTAYQTAGKGIGHNNWYSEHGKNLLLNLAIDTRIDAAEQFMINMSISLALTDVLKHYLSNHSALYIKWPNDIWYEYKKLSGLLITHIISGNRLDMSIIGIGINVNQTVFPSGLPNPGSIKSASDKHHSLQNIQQHLLQHIETRIVQLHDTEFLHHLKAEYISQLLYFNEFKNYLIRDQAVYAKIVGVNAFGQLEVLDRSGKKYECNFKEIIFPIERQG